MCLVSYAPIADGFIISSNRDEAPNRSIEQLKAEEINGHDIIFPMDSKGGSWIFCNEKGKVAVILNGAIHKHQHRPPYKISRGLMLKAFFEFNGISDFILQYNFENIEPFTAIFKDDQQLIEFRWDGIHRLIEILDPLKAHLYSSCTLYTEPIINSRAKLFYEKLEYPFAERQIKNIHRTGKIGDPENDFVMNRDERVKTVSITHVIKQKDQITLEFNHLLNDTSHKHQF